jgi:hypothetical protein
LPEFVPKASTMARGLHRPALTLNDRRRFAHKARKELR